MGQRVLPKADRSERFPQWGTGNWAGAKDDR